ncbi:hypothetical protein [Falsirhodobacter halotolerans]|uniref:hypothetical protein n=1 Tax=Falsirhodobacter halotolerans TaxID=1146892 RepID=UPI001FD0E7B4|nr:hypothetical protein [Falsirhodobacter halotolerans]
MIHPILNRRQDPRDLAVDLGQFALGLRAVGAPVPRRCVERPAVFFDEGHDQLGMQKTLLQAAQNPGLDLRPLDRRAIGAGGAALVA